MLRVVKEDGTVVSERIDSRHTFWGRLRGLMFRETLDECDGILLDPCGSIHTFFMRMEIDCFFLDAENRVLKVVPRMGPSRLSGFVGGCRRVLETAPGRVPEGLVKAGERLRIEEKAAPATARP